MKDCPKCGCHTTKVYGNNPLEAGRYRKCLNINCGESFYTVEVFKAYVSSHDNNSTNRIFSIPPTSK